MGPVSDFGFLVVMGVKGGKRRRRGRGEGERKGEGWGGGGGKEGQVKDRGGGSC
jgi:hypothetical protein